MASPQAATTPDPNADNPITQHLDVPLICQSPYETGFSVTYHIDQDAFEKLLKAQIGKIGPHLRKFITAFFRPQMFSGSSTELAVMSCHFITYLLYVLGIQQKLESLSKSTDPDSVVDFCPKSYFPWRQRKCVESSLEHSRLARDFTVDLVNMIQKKQTTSICPSEQSQERSAASEASSPASGSVEPAQALTTSTIDRQIISVVNASLENCHLNLKQKAEIEGRYPMKRQIYRNSLPASGQVLAAQHYLGKYTRSDATVIKEECKQMKSRIWPLLELAECAFGKKDLIPVLAIDQIERMQLTETIEILGDVKSWAESMKSVIINAILGSRIEPLANANVMVSELSFELLKPALRRNQMLLEHFEAMEKEVAEHRQSQEAQGILVVSLEKANKEFKVIVNGLKLALDCVGWQVARTDDFLDMVNNGTVLEKALVEVMRKRSSRRTVEQNATSGIPQTQHN